MLNIIKSIALLLFLVALPCCHSADDEELPFRLADHLKPEKYNITLIPILSPGNFTTLGTVEIRLVCIRTTNSITLNAADLDIDTSSIRVMENVTRKSLNVSGMANNQAARQTVTIQMSNALEAGHVYTVSMRFTSILNNQLRGFYRSTYEDQNGQTKYLAVTQFAAPDARLSFPCFDEPSMKAKFKVSLARPSNMSSASNMPRLDTTQDSNLPDGYVWDHYQESITMPTYLVAFMVSDFSHVPHNVPPSLGISINFGIFVRPGFENQTRYAASIAPKILAYFSKNYTNGIDYPISKLDMAAVPDFAAGAMENYGLINYREADLLFDEKRSSAVAKQRIVTIVAHELAHSWFGNLVTHAWWSNVWLKEGFARYFQHVAAEVVEPSFGLDDQFTNVVLHYAFALDALDSALPMSMPDQVINSPIEINQMYSPISYEKASCVLRMCAHLLGLETFRKGLIRYLTTKAYSNAVPDELFSALQAQAFEDRVNLTYPVKAFMDTWISKRGYPYVTISRNYTTGGAVISQKRFLLGESTDNVTDYRWHIPLTYTDNFNTPRKESWLAVGSDSTTLPNLSTPSNKWVIFNVDQVGYYRVAYDKDNLRMIQDQLMSNHRVIPIKNRAQILDDHLNLARAGVTPYPSVLSLTKYLAQETDHVPWAAGSAGLDYLDMMLFGLDNYNVWTTYMTGLVKKLYDYVKFTPGPNDPHLLIFARSTAVSWACTRLGIPDCVQKARAAFSNDINSISPDLRLPICCTAVANGGQAEWDRAYRKYIDTKLGSEKIDYLQAMACATNPTIINQMLDEMIRNNSAIRLQDANRLFSSIAATSAGHQIAMDFLINRWDDVNNYFSGFVGFVGGGNLPSFFRALCNRINKQFQLDKMVKLRDDHPAVLNSTATVRQGLELARSNLKWVNNYHHTVIQWLKTDNEVSSSHGWRSNIPGTILLLLIVKLLI